MLYTLSAVQSENRPAEVPLVIHVDPIHPVSINYTCRYCRNCDLLIAHQDEIERLLAALFQQHAPEAIGNDYLVLGTFDREYWKQGTKTPHTIQAMVEHLHNFKQVLKSAKGSKGISSPGDRSSKLSSTSWSNRGV